MIITIVRRCLGLQVEKEYLEIKEKISEEIERTSRDISSQLPVLQAGSDACHEMCSNVINMLSGVLTVMPLIPAEEREKFVTTNLIAIRNSMYAVKRTRQASLSSAQGQLSGLHASKVWIDNAIDQYIFEKKEYDGLSEGTQDSPLATTSQPELYTDGPIIKKTSS